MDTELSQNNLISVKQYITDQEGHKIAAIVDIDELNRVSELIEYLSDLKIIEDRVNEPAEDYKTYSNQRKMSINAK